MVRQPNDYRIVVADGAVEEPQVAGLLRDRRVNRAPLHRGLADARILHVMTLQPSSVSRVTCSARQPSKRAALTLRSEYRRSPTGTRRMVTVTAYAPPPMRAGVQHPARAEAEP